MPVDVQLRGIIYGLNITTVVFPGIERLISDTWQRIQGRGGGKCLHF